MKKYGIEFYDWIDDITFKDAKIVMSNIMDWLSPKSIIDFGCGEGLWLSIAKEMNADITVLGLDGDYINRDRLKISDEEFQVADLSKPFNLHKKYDLAISTEVAEHIAAEYVDAYIDNMVWASDHILFSAAIPGQGGVNHVNEQWQSYWVKKFEQRGYSADLSIREFFWNEKEMTSWRKQNIIYFSKNNQKLITQTRTPAFDVVHPESFDEKNKKLRDSYAQIMYIIDHPEIYEQLDCAVKEIIRCHNNIIIYPFGNNGKLFKSILNHKYKIKEFAIIDNYMSSNSDEFLPLIPLEKLKDIEEHFIVVDTCSNQSIHKEIEESLNNVVSGEKVYTIFR